MTGRWWKVDRVGVHGKRAPLVELPVRPQVHDGVQPEGAQRLDVGGGQAVQPISAVERLPAGHPPVDRGVAAEVTEVVDGFEGDESVRQAVGGDGGHEVRVSTEGFGRWPTGDRGHQPCGHRSRGHTRSRGTTSGEPYRSVTSAHGRDVIKRVGILGSGIMGAGLAEVAAKAGCEVIVRSRQRATADALLAGLGRWLDHRWRRASSTTDRAEILGRVVATDHLRALVECDLVIESVVEDLPVKKALFAELEQVVQARRHLRHQHLHLPGGRAGGADRAAGARAGSTSSTPRRHAPRGDRAPAHGQRRTVDALRTFALSCDKEPVVVADRAGFVVNALLFPYLNNAVRMLESGTASMEDIDAAMRGGCNFPMGPFALLDLVGLDTSLSILDALYAEFRDPNYAAVPHLAPHGRRRAPRAEVRAGLLPLRLNGPDGPH